MRDQAVEELRALNEVIERLRAPGGCPWDREQTHRTLAPYALEEVYELLEAISSGDRGAIREELGDVLLQVLMHAAIAAEDHDGFDIGEVAADIKTKMVHRHPHVFSDAVVSTAGEVVVNWERLKSRESGRAHLSVLDGVPRTLPSLARAQATQKRPARLGFDSHPTLADALATARDAFDSVESIVAALGDGPAATSEEWVVREGEISRGADTTDPPSLPLPTRAATDAVGELLFAVVALARHLRVDAENALRETTDSFAANFRRAERLARSEGLDLHGIAADD